MRRTEKKSRRREEIQSQEIRRRFLSFFEERDHRLYPSSSLIPHNDPTVLLTTAGMQQFIGFFTGQETPPTPRAVSVQKCFRTPDIEDVGDESHLTFFEMLGNFSFGDYFKKEAIEWAWEFLTVELGLPQEKLWITVFEGDEDAPEDLEAKRLWMSVGVPEERIFGLPKSENWWGPPGDSGPCGPCSEVYYDYGEEYAKGDPQKDPVFAPGGGEDSPRFLEIWNLVFNQYEQRKDGSLVPLAKTGIDTGMGLERVTAAVQDVLYVYDTDVYAPVFERARELSGVSLGDAEETDRSLRILADHARGMAFLVADGVRPGNQGREYVLRRIIRRATREGYVKLGLGADGISALALVVVETLGSFYGELREAREEIERTVREEARRFVEIYHSGMELLERELASLPSGGTLSGEVAFLLHDTYGFPVEVTRDVAAERGFTLDEGGFRRAMEDQRERARQATRTYDREVAAFREAEIRSRFVGYEREQVETHIVAIEDAPDAPGEKLFVLAENPFYATGGGQVADTGWVSATSARGGQLEVVDSIPSGSYQVLRGRLDNGADFRVGDGVVASINRVRRQQIEANHTATHILHWALRTVLGKEVHQAGSYVGPDRLRFDYRYSGRVTDEDLARIQEQCLLKITENQPVRYFTTTLDEARNLGAMMLFGEKYGDLVRVVEVDGFSRELCGGTHVRASAEVGAFKILSNKKHGADLYRIEVITGREALDYLTRASDAAETVAGELRVELEDLPQAVRELQEEVRKARESERESALRKGLEEVGSLVDSAYEVDGIKVVTGRVVASDVKGLRQITDDVKNRLGPPAAVVLAAEVGGKAVLVANLHPEASRRVGAGDLVRGVSEVLGGGGGGSPTMAQAGGGDPEKVEAALGRVRELVEELALSGKEG
ncbi:alaS: alanine--tRNA ligase [Rubrobacter radiotolerans]|uniref:Alanine--tRNA ligase n=1 Tax=Rubrobacter radiotolerans TaxID=42256 RepID=A0A023X395_RUBRA|nr:alanine--tRNA ligase [Rubrobacter radiotolerans]AHY46646.1 alaS: alanine--tRNA ligase [Rubrobacter radiotolerans]MDX5894053.1 alanine--tRNA ligase [Rubrobacter radiotolerans]SMC05069.1 alanyl-tRNA synthetase [Rubrobacter radiotolerans DSM 5868]